MWKNESEKNIMVVGHRGMRTLFPENTMISFKAALDAHVDLIEFDVRYTKDKQIVICHDETVDRTTNGEGFVCDFTLEEIKRLDAGVVKSARFTGVKIPTLEETLEIMANADYEVLLNVEIKDYNHELIDETIEMLKKYNLAERSVIACFSAEVVSYVQKTHPYMKTQGFPRFKMKDTDKMADDMYEKMYGIGIPISDREDEEIINDVKFANENNIKPWLFCTDTEKDVARAVKLGATNVTGNDPYPALRYLIDNGLHTPYENIDVTGKMQCANLHGIDNMVAEQTDIPKCNDDEVLTKIKNCGICGSDVGRVMKNGTYHFPTVPGHEFSGRVVYDKSNDFTGKRVAVFPLIPCFDCDSCKNGQYQTCSNYDYYGSRRDGGFAKYVAVKKWNLIELPDNVTYEEGAMCEPVSVALHAIKKLDIQKGDNVLITGAGTIGLIAGMWAKNFGAKHVCYVDLDARKIEFAKSLGFYEYSGENIDAVLEGTGASSAITSAIKAVKSFGKIVFMGNPHREVVLQPQDYQLILRKELKICGTWNSSYSDWKESLQAISDEKIIIRNLITHRVAIEEVYDAIKMMAKAEEFYCKVVVDNEK